MKVLKDKCGKWYFVPQLILPPWTHWKILVILCKSQVSLSRAENDMEGTEWLSPKWVSVCCKGTSESSAGPREISIFSPLKEDHCRHKSRLGKGLHSNGTFQWHWRPHVVAKLSSVTISNWSLLSFLQHTRFRGCLGNAIRDVSGCNKWEFPPRRPSEGGSSVEPGRMTDAVAHQGQEWQLAPLSHIQRRIPRHCNSPGFSPKFLRFHTHKGSALVLEWSSWGRQIILSPCAAFTTERWTSSILNKEYSMTVASYHELSLIT